MSPIQFISSIPFHRVTFFRGLACVLAILVLSNGARAQNRANSKGEAETVLTKDGWPIHMTYYKSQRGKNAAVVVLMHMKGSNRLVWDEFATTLNESGENYAVITVDLRKHGESKTRGDDKKSKKTSSGRLTRVDYQGMVYGDLEAVKQFVYEEHQKQNLNMRKLALVGAEMSGPLALMYTLEDWGKPPHKDAPTVAASTPRGQDVQGVVLLSPDVSLAGATASKAISYIKGNMNIGVLVCVGAQDETYKKNAERIYQQLGGKNVNKDRIYYQEFDPKLRGTDLIGKRLNTEAYIRAFLKKHVDDLDIDWRDRKSRLAR